MKHRKKGIPAPAGNRIIIIIIKVKVTLRLTVGQSVCLEVNRFAFVLKHLPKK
jgi:hypothetical protein